MSILSVDPKGLLEGIGSLAKSIRTAITGKEPINAEKAAELAFQVQELELKTMQAQNELMLGQMEVNKVEAQSTKPFVSGWRPFVGWVCGCSLAYAAILQPLISWVAMVSGYKGSFPILDTTLTMQVLFGMLGLGVMRTVDKSNILKKGTGDGSK